MHFISRAKKIRYCASYFMILIKISTESKTMRIVQAVLTPDASDVTIYLLDRQGFTYAHLTSKTATSPRSADASKPALTCFMLAARLAPKCRLNWSWARCSVMPPTLPRRLFISLYMAWIHLGTWCGHSKYGRSQVVGLKFAKQGL